CARGYYDNYYFLFFDYW
nr:immunoglobulin heavy chain junction region [Macaca mulatta]MOV50201.1 immunoglobulin heavy chain junction region [Macaca mulatta]MOV50457.1 immunoglobulin heavy chain junction region [Macaca mulatta]MOV51064.1 immunoglobulin heavy chain junction region [Macaca mulatta]MOV51105.1 immunoglobulin heavy chain junction region [Macaca mulatta]